MGPRSIDRGIGCTGWLRIRSLPGFNGAAIYRSRNSSAGGASRYSIGSFNGAAIYRSRNCLEPQLGVAAGTELQWGRDLSIAELWSAIGMAGRGILLQWGRDLSIAELMATMNAGVGSPRLQWGRDLSIAELSYAL